MQCSALTVVELEPETLSPVTTPATVTGVAEQQALTAGDVNCPSPDAVVGDVISTYKHRLSSTFIHTKEHTLTITK